MSFRQVYYTSCRKGLRGSPGFQVNAASPGIAPDLLQQVERLCVYVPPVSAPSRPGPGELEQFPLALVYQLLGQPLGQSTGQPNQDSATVVAQARYIGADYSGRFGNYFAHCLITTSPATDLGALLPIQLWRSPLWSTKESETTELPEAATPAPGGALDLPQLAAFLADKGRLEHLADFVTAAEQALRTRRRVVIVDSSDCVARWIAAACFVLPRNLALQLTFNTYVKSPYQTDALIVGTTADSDFGFAPHEIRHTVFLFDFVGDRFTPIESPSPLGVLAALALRPERVEHLSGYHAFIAAVEPELPLEQAGIALASYCKLVGMTVPGFDSAQLARWCAPRLLRFPTPRVGPLFAQLLDGPVTAQAIEVALTLMAGATPQTVPRETQAAAAAVIVGWVVRAAAAPEVSGESLSQITDALAQMAELASVASQYPLDWAALLGSTREPARLLLYVLLGERLGGLGDRADTLRELGEAVVGPALGAAPLQRPVAALASSSSLPLLEGIAAYLLCQVREPRIFTELGTLLASERAAEVLQTWALTNHALLLYFHLCRARAGSEAEGRITAFQHCLAGVERAGEPLTGPLVESAMTVVFSDKPPRPPEELQVLSAVPSAVLAQTRIPAQFAERLARSAAAPGTAATLAIDHELAARLGADELRGALGPAGAFLELFAAAAHLDKPDWADHLVSVVTLAYRVGPDVGEGVCRRAANKLAEPQYFSHHRALVPGALAACPWFEQAYFAAMNGCYLEVSKLEPADVVSLLECWLELERTPAHASIAGLLIQQVLPPIVRRWGRKDRAAANNALRHSDAAQDRLRTALGIVRKRWKILFWILPVMLGSLVIVGVLLVRSGYQLKLQWPPSLSKQAPPKGGSPPVAPARGGVK
ncbi:MAG TPA: hypothetical protein PLW65_08890 [Pseudomonadota bacterium]|nr:hypothetical protein [Pseudomonadota bacterium]